MALQRALAIRLNAPLIGTFTSRQSFTRELTAGTPANRVTAIYAEPSPRQQMRLIAALYKRTVTVGVLLSEQSEFMLPLLQEAATDHHLELVSALADLSVNLSRNLLRLAQATVLLISPDTALYTQASLRELLESTYRRRQPVIGFSEALVSAGTLASAYSDIDDTLSQLQAVVATLAEGRLPEPQYPRFWRVAINDSVARSLDVVIDDAVRRMGERP
jgi:putative ABC transport system substrate-binding protein